MLFVGMGLLSALILLPVGVVLATIAVIGLMRESVSWSSPTGRANDRHTCPGHAVGCSLSGVGYPKEGGARS